MRSPIAININFDSLNENLGFPANFRDPSYFKIADRFMDFSARYGFRYSLYIIGKDLENPEYAARVKAWHEQGHEIGNHTYHHHLGIAYLSPAEIEDEVMRSHDSIARCTGEEPRGFISPGWTSSNHVLNVLLRHRYLYDTSLLPSLILYPAILKNVFNHLRHPGKMREILNRKDYLYPFTKPIRPFLAGHDYRPTHFQNPEKIVILPLPTLHRFRPSFWHTMMFLYGLKRGKRHLTRYLEKCDYFYYLLHPADLAEEQETHGYNHSVERLGVSLEKKQRLMTEVFDLMRDSGRGYATMREMAEAFLQTCGGAA